MSDNYEKFNSAPNKGANTQDSASDKKQQSDIDKARQEVKEKVRDTLDKK